MSAQEDVTPTEQASSSAVVLSRRVYYWVLENIFRDHAMKFAVGFFAITLFGITRYLFPGS